MARRKRRNHSAQFTSEAFTGVLNEHGIAISMAGRGCHLRCRLAVVDAARAGSCHDPVMRLPNRFGFDVPRVRSC